MTSDRIQQLQGGIAEKWDEVECNDCAGEGSCVNCLHRYPHLLQEYRDSAPHEHCLDCGGSGFNTDLHMEGLLERMRERWPEFQLHHFQSQSYLRLYNFADADLFIGEGASDEERTYHALNQALEAEKESDAIQAKV